MADIATTVHYHDAHISGFEYEIADLALTAAKQRHKSRVAPVISHYHAAHLAERNVAVEAKPAKADAAPIVHTHYHAYQIECGLAGEAGQPTARVVSEVSPAHYHEASISSEKEAAVFGKQPDTAAPQAVHDYHEVRIAEMDPARARTASVWFAEAVMNGNARTSDYVASLARDMLQRGTVETQRSATEWAIWQKSSRHRARGLKVMHAQLG